MISKKAALVGTLAMVALSFPMGAVAANKLIVKDSAGTTDQMVVTDSGWVGIGNNAPGGPIDVRVNANTILEAGLTYVVNALGTSPLPATAPNFSLYRNNADQTVNGGVLRDGDSLGYFQFGSVINGAPRFLARIGANAEGSWDPNTVNTTSPTYLQFMTSGPNQIKGFQRMTISSLGNVGINTYNMATQKLEVNGGIKINPGNQVRAGGTVPVQPTCTASERGTLWLSKKSGSPDELQICVNTDGGTTFAWKAISLSTPTIVAPFSAQPY